MNLSPSNLVMSPVILEAAVEVVEPHVDDKRIAPDVVAEVEKLKDFGDNAPKETVWADPFAVVGPERELALREEAAQDCSVQFEKGRIPKLSLQQMDGLMRSKMVEKHRCEQNCDHDSSDEGAQQQILGWVILEE